MTLRYEQVIDDQDIATLAQVADEIWHEYWPDRIGMAQTDYMIEQFQSVAALTRDIREHHYLYYLVYDPYHNLVGYTGGCAEHFENDPFCARACTHGTAIAQRSSTRLFISKIYLYKEQRGKHYASRIIEFWEECAQNEDLNTLYLTVNKDNELAIRAYLGRGFEILEAHTGDIGQGFVMDDYIMAKAVSLTPTR